ncbi:MAG: helix-turn-helix transcriptional regulator [Bacteroidales bacterium]|jgi:AraC-like DNA-binding protein|nr:helix-turn-helix transcriptional regulator [Bacteroidales bacterium]
MKKIHKCFFFVCFLIAILVRATANDLSAKALKFRYDELKQNYIYILIIVIMLIILVLLLLIYIYQIRKKNKFITQHIQQRHKYVKMLQGTRIGTIAKLPDRKLFEQLDAIIKTNNAFLTNDINRSSLAKASNTNEEYVRRAIKHYTSMGVAEYITALRLQHSLILLADDKTNDTINVIASECGFNSVSTFHRLFMNRYGISPNEYRKNMKGQNQSLQ